MKLYYAPFACSLAAHITCREAGLPVSLLRVDLASKRIEGGGDLFVDNPMGQVPTLVTDDARTLTENVAVLSYLAERAPTPAGDAGVAYDRYELTRWLSFVSTEVHKKVLHPIFAATTPDPVKEYARGSVERALSVLAAQLESRDALLGSSFSAADAYLLWAVMLMRPAGISLDPYPALKRYLKRHAARPAVAAAVAFDREQQAHPFAA